MWHHAASPSAHVEVVSSWNGWKRPGDELPADRADGFRVRAYEPPPGEQGYAIIEDGTWLTDDAVPTTAFHEGHEVTWVDVPTCDTPETKIDEATATSSGEGALHLHFLAARGGAPLDPTWVQARERGGADATAEILHADPASGAVDVALHTLSPGKHTIEVVLRDRDGRLADPKLAVVWVESRPFDLRDTVIYQVMVDRFRASDGSPLTPPNIASDRAGGTVRGVTSSLDAIAALGANTIWLSPLYPNPAGTFPGSDGRTYSSYHGYWPIASRGIEPLLGSEADVDALVQAAHARGMRVVFDVVPNHVHQQHPYAKDHKKPGDDWFNDTGGGCVCGTRGCDWSTHIQDCWFAPYLPDLDWTNPVVADQVTSDVLYWMDRFDGDGLRIDAVPMMPRAAARRIAAGVRDRFDQGGHRSLVLGENFTGPGGYSLLKYQLGPFGLDSEFHFPLMWSLRRVVATGSAPMTDLESTILSGEAAWEGSGAVMGLMIGNHDVSRFSSVSAGDADGDGWTPAGQATEALVYAKQTFALGVVYTLPGAPVVYYGDEVALAGRQDPDSRRVMPAEADLTDAQKATRDAVTRLGKARACVTSLRRGGYRTLFVDDEHLVFAREADGEAPAIVVLGRAPTAAVGVPLPGISAGDYVDLVGGARASLRPELTNLAPEPFSVHVYVPASSACASLATSP